MHLLLVVDLGEDVAAISWDKVGEIRSCRVVALSQPQPGPPSPLSADDLASILSDLLHVLLHSGYHPVHHLHHLGEKLSVAPLNSNVSSAQQYVVLWSATIDHQMS